MPKKPSANLAVGSPETRFVFLMGELQKRILGGAPYFAARPPEIEYIKWVDETIVKLAKYERIFHALSLHSQTGSEKTKHLVWAIDSWSYAHRAGNGELTEDEKKKNIDHALDQIIKVLNTPTAELEATLPGNKREALGK